MAVKTSTGPIYAFTDDPKEVDLGDDDTRALFLNSLRDSRRSVITGAFLTKANVVSNTLNVVGHLNLRFGVHEFPKTVIARATVTMNVRQAVAPTKAAAAGPAAGVAPKAVFKAVNVPELVFGFDENPEVFYLVPRDSTLEKTEDRATHLYTFLTLRNQPGGNTLQHQVIPVTFPSDEITDGIVDVMRTHINKHVEVKEKMANAFRHIPKMAVTYLALQQPTRPTTEPHPVVETPAGPDSRPDGDDAAIDQVVTTADQAKDPSSRRRRRRTKKEKGKEKKKRQKDTSVVEIDAASATKVKKQKKASIIPEGWKCEICGIATTVMRRRGPSGLNCACETDDCSRMLWKY